MLGSVACSADRIFQTQIQMLVPPTQDTHVMTKSATDSADAELGVRIDAAQAKADNSVQYDADGI